MKNLKLQQEEKPLTIEEKYKYGIGTLIFMGVILTGLLILEQIL